MADISAVIIDKKTIKVELKVSFYGGKSEYFRLRDDFGFSTKLPIIKTVESEDVVSYFLENEYFDLSKIYTISDEHNMSCILQPGFYVRTKEFDDEYFYSGNDLGATYTKKKTVFKVWSPIASEVLLKADAIYPMTRSDKGVYTVEVKKNMDSIAYTYLVNICGKWTESVDPYAYSSTPNGKKSVVIDLNKCKVTQNKELLPDFNNFVDAVIYELHVRDFSSNKNSGLANRGKFLAFTEENTKNENGTVTGLDYISSLGVSHIQILPFYDFGSVDELNQFDYYNWGYDPIQYSIPEGSYASEINNPYSRVIDCKKMIAAIHKKGMRVIMDVVYNHMFGIEITSFHNLMPLYYFRYGENGEISNGSFCGNDFDSTRKMASKYIIDSVTRWTEFYGIDGLRFDLMGIIDYETINKVYEECHKIENSFMVYGEGWNMPSLIPDEIKATQFNNAKMPKIGHFNDRFRDCIKGSTQQDNIQERGYATGNKEKSNLMMDLLCGTCLDVDYDYSYLSPNQVINYAECHDNNTLWDKLEMSLIDESVEDMKKYHKLIMAIIFLSQGIPFIDGGQEFLRTKLHDHNSYISSDAINGLDYSLIEKNKDIVTYTKALINFRKNNPCFRLNTKEEISNQVFVELMDEIVIKYTVKDYVVYFNPSNEIMVIDLESEKTVLDIETMEEMNTTKITLDKISATIIKK